MAEGTRIKLSPWLAGHYQQDDMPAWMVKNNYAAAVNIITHPEKFPKADFDLVAKLADELFYLDPVAVSLGV